MGPTKERRHREQSLESSPTQMNSDCAMIKKMHLLFTGFIIIAGPTGVTGKPRSADEIINKYIKARGGYKKLKAIETLRMTGTYQEGKNIYGTYIEWKRPWFRVVVVAAPRTLDTR
jgi:hypothetical protein